MLDESKCPECGEEVPEAMLKSAYGVGKPPTEGGRQHMDCPACDAKLVRRGPGDPWELAKA